MLKFNHYKATFYLCGALVLTEAFWIVFFVIPRTPEYAQTFTFVLITTVITILGVLVQSNLIRYLGAVIMTGLGAGLIWGLISNWRAFFQTTNVVLVLPYSLYYSLSGVLNLLTAAILLFSKQFADEFAKRRESAPKYIGHLRLLLVGAVVAAILLNTFNDIVNLANAP